MDILVSGAIGRDEGTSMGWQSRWQGGAALAMAAWVAAAIPVAAKDPAPAILTVDGESGRVLEAENAGQLRNPASLTKMMTVFLAFAALEENRVKPDDRVTVSAKAAGQQGTTLGLKAGAVIPLGDALKAIIVRSANDAAVAVAEHLAGSETEFASHMTKTARDLGMTATTFHNATGLTLPGHLTTARDMAVLALALRKRFPDRYALFGTRSVAWNKQVLPTVNGFLVNYKGAEGMKTGFTCPAGYNVVAAAARDGRRTVAVIMGAQSRPERNALVARVMDRTFKKEVAVSARALDVLANERGPAPDLTTAVCGNGVLGLGSGPSSWPKGWALEVSYSNSEKKARSELARAQGRLASSLGTSGNASVVQDALGGQYVYRGLITGLQEQPAIRTCLAMRKRNEDCLVLTPQMLEGAYDTQRRLRMIAREKRENSH